MYISKGSVPINLLHDFVACSRRLEKFKLFTFLFVITEICCVNVLDNQVVVKIRARTVYGARHGVESLGQLVTGFTAGARGRRVLVMVTQAHIVDEPAFAHRGLLLDTARNYLPLSAIMRTIDGMGHVKLNVLHWHITDSQSFPLYTLRVPQLAL